jgi:2,5-furandicarboxylate decarboxylase 1
MPDQSYRTMLANLEQQGELIRFTKEVDPLIDMAAVEWKAFNELGKASLFTNIKGHGDWQACSQIVADRKKWAIGLNIPEDDLLDQMGKRLQNPIAPEIINRKAPVKHIIKTGNEIDLFDFPTMKTSEKDGGRYFASGIAVIKDPETGIRNLSVHRQMVTGKNKTGFIMIPRQARQIYDKYCARGEAMPVAMIYGTHPAIFFASSFTTAFGNDEYGLAGALMNEPVRLIKCETIDLEVPAEAEIVIEGEVLPKTLEPEGPFGEVTGTYAGGSLSEVFQVKAITQRKDPIFYALHCGFPITDAQSTMGIGVEVATKNHLKDVEGGLNLLDVRAVTEAGVMMLIIKMRPRHPGQAKTALMAALSGPYLHPKLAIAVDADIDASDLRQIAWSMTTRVHAERDVTMIPDTRVFALDNISPMAPGMGNFARIGTKWMIDATIPAHLSEEERYNFEPAFPNNFKNVNLKDYLP